MTLLFLKEIATSQQSGMAGCCASSGLKKKEKKVVDVQWEFIRFDVSCNRRLPFLVTVAVYLLTVKH